ncbi:MAG: gliding motility protein GldL [Chlorobi bacterium]|nr:gliding motility protein GldL [Chlorobiota bacterium]
MGLFNFTRTRGYRNFMAKVYGWGASIVLLGAMFKINHYPGADIMLVIGLGTEAIIFFFSAFEPPFVEPDWSLVYPELAGMYHKVDDGSILQKRKSATERLDEMFEKAKLDQRTIDKLGNGIEKLAENASQLSDLSSVASATNEFATNVQQASNSARIFGESVAKDAETTGYYAESLQTTMSVFLEKLEQSSASATEFHDQMENLTTKMSELNKVYGNILTAMNVKG